MTFGFEGRFGSAVSAMKGQNRRFSQFRQCQRSVDHQQNHTIVMDRVLMSGFGSCHHTSLNSKLAKWLSPKEAIIYSESSQHGNFKKMTWELVQQEMPLLRKITKKQAINGVGEIQTGVDGVRVQHANHQTMKILILSIEKITLFLTQCIWI